MTYPQIYPQGQPLPADPAFLPTTRYPNLRLMLTDSASLSDAELETVFESAFGEGVSPAEYEEFFGGLGRALSSVAQDVGRFAQRAAPVAASVAQGALQGAATGSALGPYGAIAGALAGGVGSGLAQHGGGTARQVGQAISGGMNLAGSLTGRGAMAGGVGQLLGGLAGGRGGAGGAVGGLGQLLGGLGGGRAGGAAGQLLGLMQNPTVMGAISSLAGGGNGAVRLGRGGPQVPASSFAGLLGALGREAEAESAANNEAENEPLPPVYLLDLLNRLPAVPVMRSTAPPRWEAEQESGEAEAEVYDSEFYEAEFIFDSDSESEAEAYAGYGSEFASEDHRDWSW